MNRFDTALAADTSPDSGVTTLSPERLGNWDGEDFALAIELARAPATFASGLGDALVHLVVAEETIEDGEAILPFTIEGETLTLGIGQKGLDALTGLLGADVSVSAGANLSLDAIEALCVAVLSPLMRIDAARASWGPSGHTVAALKIGDVQLSIVGEASAILALQRAIVTAGAAQSTSFALLGQPLAQRIAVSTQQVVAIVCLAEQERAALEPGCGIVLDTLWPNGRQVAGQRFVKSGVHWHVDADLRRGCFHVRAAAQVQMLDELLLGTSSPDPSGLDLELMDGEQVIAHGHMTSLEVAGTQRVIFQVDQLV